jgi:D-methionine transport system permease protein
MAGAIGGGGLGDLAIRYGYYRFDTEVLIVSVIVIIIMVQSIQYFGNTLSAKINKK